MYFHHQTPMILTALVLYLISLLSPAAGDAAFDRHYAIDYGQDHVKFLDSQKTRVQLSLNTVSGARFSSKVKYGSGFFNMWIKLPPGDSAGVVTAFYLRSGDKDLDEVDFEFLGNKPGKNISIQTNVFANGVGNREQKLVLPFDPTADYHDYRILWNPHMIVMYIDGVPIRVFKNNRAIGVDYPSKPMQILASIWNGDYWATDGGRTKIDWSDAPFAAQFRSFDVDGCSATHRDCASTKYWWNNNTFRDLDGTSKLWYKAMRTLITYDYCTDTERYPVPPPECASNSYL